MLKIKTLKKTSIIKKAVNKTKIQDPKIKNKRFSFILRAMRKSGKGK